MVLAASPRAEAERDFLASPGLGDGDGLEYKPPRPAQKPRGDFVLAGMSLGMLPRDAAEEIRASRAGTSLVMLPSDAAFAI